MPNNGEQHALVEWLHYVETHPRCQWSGFMHQFHLSKKKAGTLIRLMNHHAWITIDKQQRLTLAPKGERTLRLLQENNKQF